ncbi:MAG: DNA topoisomerase IV subunit B [Rhodospirillaceae bacterium]|nr:DNA topoisomerase IV subunit B [Rhodospirillaceae bacterium]|tara:strand:- start:25513 stop:27492 length:1980 start_codon:yes stop_codon:yes gene_type:complete
MAASRKRATRKSKDYSAQDIEVLEGLEPVRRRPAMYIGGSDERAMHHLAAELLDNAMDEAVAGHANWIEFDLTSDGTVSIRDNGRGIPTDPHPKFKDKSALEVVMTTLHSGGKFSNKVYDTSGGLHGVGLSVVNALSDQMTVEVARDKTLFVQEYSKGKPKGKLKNKGKVRRRGTTVIFHPDPEIFGARSRFRPNTLFKMARSKAYLYKGVEIRWSCAADLIGDKDDTPEKATLHFPGGLSDYLATRLDGRATIIDNYFSGEAKLNGKGGRVEWALAWPEDGEGSLVSYCNTVPTPEGGTHETGLRAALTKGLKSYAELAGNKRGNIITGDDVVGGAWGVLSVFVPDPEFQGQTKDKLTTTNVARNVENSLKDHFDHFLSGDPAAANKLLERVIERAEDRLRRRQAKETARKSATRKLRLPGKLADCAKGSSEGTEIFLVEGDSAGGSAKSARNRNTQAILPLRGKILNVASATADKLRANQELSDMIQALGCGTGSSYDDEKLRYERVIIMTDADVDGAHIASLLMTFFFREMPRLIENGHLYLALPPLYRISQGALTMYAKDDAHREQLLEEEFTGRGRIEVSRFKGLGEMPAQQLKETTMDPEKRNLVRVTIPDSSTQAKDVRQTETLVEDLMGRKPERRLAFIQKNAQTVQELDV